MRLRTLLILLALVVSLSSPLTAHVPILPTDQVNCFVTLDVCHAYGSYISTNADGACLHEPHCQLLTPACAGFVDILDYHSRPYTLSFQLERPPKS